MTRQQEADEILAAWQALWPLSPAERLERIDHMTLEDARRNRRCCRRRWHRYIRPRSYT